MNRLELRAKFRSLIDDQGLNREIFDDTRINQFLYDGALSVQSLIENLDEDFFTITNSFAVEGSSTILGSIPRLSKVRFVYDEFDREEIVSVTSTRALQYEMENRFTRVYYLSNNTLYYPVSKGSNHSIKIAYTTTLVDLQSDESAWGDIPEIAQTLIPYEAAVMAIAAEDSDIRQMLAMVQQRRQQIIYTLENRSQSKSRVVRDNYYA